MSKSSFPDAARGAESWAEVRARDQVMRYRRSGIGRPVLLLGPPGSAEPPWPELAAALEARFRLIVPEPPRVEAQVADWLGNFLEGLGISSVSIVAMGCFSMPVLELTLREADQIARIVLVRDGEGEGRRAEGRGILDTAIRRTGVPLLLLRQAQPAGEMVPLVTGFLLGDGDDVAA